MFLNFVLVSDNISRIGSRYMEHSRLYICNQLAAFNLRRRYLHRVLIFHFVVFALCRNGPAVQACHLAVGIQEDDDGAVFATAGTQDFVRPTNSNLDLVTRDDVDIRLTVEQRCVGLLVVCRQWRVYLRMHPRRGVS